jgi:two-component system, sensor histidine kinase LadS
MKIRFFCFLLFTLAFAQANGQDTLILHNSQKDYSISGKAIEVFEDTSNSDKEIRDKESIPFKKNHSFYFTAEHPQYTYWAKLTLIDSSDFSNHWFFVSYNYSVDSLDIYAYNKSGQLFSKQYRFLSTRLSDKEVEHKNLTWDFTFPKNEPVTIYIKAKNKNTSQYGFALREHKEYFSSSMYEYFFFGTFYGGLLMISLYHLIFFFSLRDYSYLFYSAYIIMQGIYMCYRDATALVFIFPDSPAMLDATYGLIMFLLAFSVSLYSRFFLELNSYKWSNFFIIAFVVFRLPFLLFSQEYPVWLMWFDMIAALLPFILSVVSLMQGHKTAILFMISFGVIIIGFFINLLWHVNIIPGTRQVFYSLYYAIGIESLMLALANAYRLRKLKEASLLKNVLEEKINENTLKISRQEELIKEKSDDLDMLLYRASHDIKGPLKSIDGLCLVGQMDEHEKNIYFKRIASSSKRLQNILNSLLDIAKQNRADLRIENVNLYKLTNECINEHLREYPGFNDMQFLINIPEINIRSEKYSLLSIVQNIVENAVKYRDVKKEKNILSVTLVQFSDFNKIIFEDNGMGINEPSLKKIFQMFYRANTDASEGAGLGLYIVKQNVERLNGKISISSNEGEYTLIEIRLPVKYA